MTVWELLWKLIVHVCHGRGRDEVHLNVNVDRDGIPTAATGQLLRFERVASPDTFCVLFAKDETPGPPG